MGNGTTPQGPLAEDVPALEHGHETPNEEGSGTPEDEDTATPDDEDPGLTEWQIEFNRKYGHLPADEQLLNFRLLQHEADEAAKAPTLLKVGAKNFPAAKPQETAGVVFTYNEKMSIMVWSRSSVSRGANAEVQ